MQAERFSGQRVVNQVVVVDEVSTTDTLLGATRPVRPSGGLG